ncbi:unnamed protein product [Phytomonas sp. EM1]|nr:unnamed protein product [Phytomonas sp. EM1]|eukprot:CCW64339.1 unnamed protein product [Phytomonas sp. isolate EM1]
MDIHPFSLVRPQSRLIDKVVRHFLMSPREQLVFQRTDMLYTYALNDYVDHAEALKLLIYKLSHVPVAFREMLDTERGILPLGCAPRLFQTIQRFPDSVNSMKLEAEGAVVDYFRENLPRDGLTSVEMNRLWIGAAQCTRWDSVRALFEHFPLRQTLAYQSPEEVMDVISAVCAGRGRDPAEDGPLTPRERLLKEVLGEDEAWRLCEGVLQGDGDRMTALRDRAAVLRVLLAARRGCWPEEGRAGASQREAAVVSVQSPTLHVWGEQVWALHQPCIPPALREAHFHQAMVQGLWQLYMTMDCEGVMGFLTRGLPLLVEGHPDFPWWRTIRRYHHEALLGRKEICSKSGSGPPKPEPPFAPLRNALSIDSLANIIISSAWLHTHDEAGDGESTWLPGVLRQLKDALKERLHGPPRTRSSGGEVQNPLLLRLEDPGDALVRRVPLIIVVYVVMALEKILNVDVSAGPSQGVVEAADELLHLVQEHVLRQSILDEHGSARVVAFLLLHAPNMTQRLDLEQTCVRLIKAHYRDGGFTREQLEGLLKLSESGRNGFAPDRYGIDAELRKGMREVLEQLPLR